MSQDDLKQAVAEASLDYVEPGMWLGLGSGSTAERMVHALGARVQAGLSLAGVVSSSPRTAEIARGYGLEPTPLSEVDQLDLTIDGADEVDPNLDLIKGGGGQHLHEKILAAASERLLILVDESKLVERLGAFRVPLEVVPVAERLVRRRVEELGGEARRREVNGEAFRTTEHNLVLDCDFGLLDEPAALARALSDLPGAVEHGLFIGMTHRVLVARPSGVETITPT